MDGAGLSFLNPHCYTYYPTLSTGPLTGGQRVCAWGQGRGVPTYMLPWWLSSSFKLGSHLKVGLLFETRIWACVKPPQGLQKPTDDSCCWEMRRDVDLRDPALPWEPVEAPRGPLWPPFKTGLVPLPSPSLWCPGIWAAVDRAWKVTHQWRKTDLMSISIHNMLFN